MDPPARTANEGLHVVLLAAGKATRFGSPKQLAIVGGRTMLARALDAATSLANARGDAVTVVLGAYADRLTAIARESPVTIAVNADHREGIASSIRVGVAGTPSSARGVLILLADQVAVTLDDLRRLVARWEQEPSLIVAADHGGSIGAPAIFPRELFPELLALRGDRGARGLMLRHADRLATVTMPSASSDVDTPAELSSES